MTIRILAVAAASLKSKSSTAHLNLVLVVLFQLPHAVFAETYQDQPKFLISKNVDLPNLEKEKCVLLSRGLDQKLEQNNPGLNQLIKSFKKHIEDDDTKDLYKLFHPRAKIKQNIGEKIISILRNRYDKKWKLNTLRVWALINPTKGKSIFECPNTEGYKPISRYGYEHQYFVIIQIHSNSELGRIILSISPKDKDLYITGMHIQQWTHMGHDWLHWTQTGNQFLEKKNLLEAYKSYDVAQKLLQAPDFIDYDFLPEIIQNRNAIYSQEKFLELTKQTFKNNNIIYIGTTLRKEGIGIFVRIRIEKEQVTKELQAQCKKLGTEMISRNWLTNKDAGIKCSFNLPQESSDKDGVLGGFYFNREQL